jgi:hypothetical protein
MNADNMTTDQWVDQQHAEALDALKNAGTYILLTVTEAGIKILDGSPGDSGCSMHDQLCTFAMLEGYAKSRRKIIERDMAAVSTKE